MKFINKNHASIIIGLILSFFVLTVEAGVELHIDMQEEQADHHVIDVSESFDLASLDNHCCQLHCQHLFMQNLTTPAPYNNNSQLLVTTTLIYQSVRLPTLLRPPAIT